MADDPPRDPHIGLGGLEARCGDTQIRIFCHRLTHEGVERGIIKVTQPTRPRRRIGCARAELARKRPVGHRRRRILPAGQATCHAPRDAQRQQ